VYAVVFALVDLLGKENGLLDKAAKLMYDWVKKQDIKGLDIEVNDF
jgi:hypothetical protein